MAIDIKELEKLLARSHDKQSATEFIIQGQKANIEKLTVKCDAECQAARAAKAQVEELEKAAAEKPEKEIVHHKLAPWAEDCPDCDYHNPHPVPKDRIKTDEVCTNCKSPVLEDWDDCPECGEKL